MGDKKVFLGGTCNGSKWRDALIPKLTIDYFNPVVEKWTEECKKEEILQRSLCDIIFYAITPRMKSVYSIAEAVDDSNKRPEKTIFALFMRENNYDTWYSQQLNSLEAVIDMIALNGAKTITVADYDDICKLAKMINEF